MCDVSPFVIKFHQWTSRFARSDTVKLRLPTVKVECPTFDDQDCSDACYLGSKLKLVFGKLFPPWWNRAEVQSYTESVISFCPFLVAGLHQNSHAFPGSDCHASPRSLLTRDDDDDDDLFGFCAVCPTVVPVLLEHRWPMMPGYKIFVFLCSFLAAFFCRVSASDCCIRQSLDISTPQDQSKLSTQTLGPSA